MPSAAPITVMIADSAAIIWASWPRRMPIARSSPSSLVRSTMDSASVFAMPSSAMMIASASSAVTRPSRLPSMALRFCA